MTLLEREGRIEDLLLSGDVLVFPESGLEDLAGDLAGTSLEPAALEAEARHSLEGRGIHIPGVGAAEVAEAITAARK